MRGPPEQHVVRDRHLRRQLAGALRHVGDEAGDGAPRRRHRRAGEAHHPAGGDGRSARSRSRVDFPAPFGPMTPSQPARATVRLTDETTGGPP